jgi:hypothetical protein
MYFGHDDGGGRSDVGDNGDDCNDGIVMWW